MPPEVTNSPSASPVILETTCILITTGTGQYDNGFIDVSVSNGTGYVEVTTPLTNYAQGQVVLDECYLGLVGVQVTNNQTNAWGGNIAYSFGDKASVYFPMKCTDCTGTVDTSEFIVVDGNDDGSGDTKCLDGIGGNVCTLLVGTQSPTNAPTISEVPTTSPKPTAYYTYTTEGQG